MDDEVREETNDLLEPERDAVSTVMQVGLVEPAVLQEDWNCLPVHVLLNRKCPLPLSSLAVARATSKSGEGS